MKTIERTKWYPASPEAVFDCLDDLGVTGMHMQKSSMPLMGGKMELAFLTENRTGPHSRYRWTGKVLWMRLDFTVEVTRWLRGREKTWETVGRAKIILYSWFQMHFTIEPASGGSRVHLSIAYKRPEGAFNRILCFFLGEGYGVWCLKSMLTDTEGKLAAGKRAAEISSLP